MNTSVLQLASGLTLLLYIFHLLGCMYCVLVRKEVQDIVDDHLYTHPLGTATEARERLDDGEESFLGSGAGQRIARIRGALADPAQTHFSVRADRELVTRLWSEFVIAIGDAMNPARRHRTELGSRRQALHGPWERDRPAKRGPPRPRPRPVQVGAPEPAVDVHPLISIFTRQVAHSRRVS